MTDLSSFPITRKWPAKHPDRIQLYSLPTPNGVKVSIMLEETGLAYEPHRVRFDRQDQTSPEFLSLNPNGKIPAIIDPNGPEGRPLPLFESGAILHYLADKAGRFLPNNPVGRLEAIQWLMFQLSSGAAPVARRRYRSGRERSRRHLALAVQLLSEVGEPDFLRELPELIREQLHWKPLHAGVRSTMRLVAGSDPVPRVPELVGVSVVGG